MEQELGGYVLTIADVLRARSVAFDRNHDAKRLDVANGLSYTRQDWQAKAAKASLHWLGTGITGLGACC